jgi:IstB-like ATP binding protein
MLPGAILRPIRGQTGRAVPRDLGAPTLQPAQGSQRRVGLRGSGSVRSQSLGKQLVQPKLLIVDEIGYLPLDRLGANLFFQLVSRRYERGSILVTSNQSLTGWGQVFGDQIIATAILDRLLHHSTTVNIKGESYRLKEKRKAGLLTRSEPYTEAGADVEPAS